MSSIVTVSPDGTVEAVYDDELADVLKDLGSFDVRRASHVEYDSFSEGWLVEMLEPERFCVGPFGLRREALAWEVEYLEQRLAGASDSEAALAAVKVSEKQKTI